MIRYTTLLIVAITLASCSTRLHVSQIARAQVIGALDIPLGNVAVIQGCFIDRRLPDHKGMADFCQFEVTHVNGKEMKERIAIEFWIKEPIAIPTKDGLVNMAGSSYVGLKPPSKPKTTVYSSKALTIRAYETAGWSGAPSGLNWDEMYSTFAHHFTNELIILPHQQPSSN